jgi:hypothetical protein
MSNEDRLDRPWGGLKTTSDRATFFLLHWVYGGMTMLCTTFFASLVGRPLDIANSLTLVELVLLYPLVLGMSIAFIVRFTSALWKMSLP